MCSSPYYAIARIPQGFIQKNKHSEETGGGNKRFEDVLYNSRCQQSRYASRQTDSDKPLSQEEKMREAKNKDRAEDEDTQNIDWESCEITQGYEKKKQRERQESKLTDTKQGKEAARAVSCTWRCVFFKEREKEGRRDARRATRAGRFPALSLWDVQPLRHQVLYVRFLFCPYLSFFLFVSFCAREVSTPVPQSPGTRGRRDEGLMNRNTRRTTARTRRVADDR